MRRARASYFSFTSFLKNPLLTLSFLMYEMKTKPYIILLHSDFLYSWLQSMEIISKYQKVGGERNWDISYVLPSCLDIGFMLLGLQGLSGGLSVKIPSRLVTSVTLFPLWFLHSWDGSIFSLTMNVWIHPDGSVMLTLEINFSTVSKVAFVLQTKMLCCFFSFQCYYEFSWLTVSLWVLLKLF